jgi:hypothetical protein
MGPLATGNRPAFSNLRGVENNPRLQRGITAMPSDRFGRAAVADNQARVSSAALREGGTSGSMPGPGTGSFRTVDRAANPTTIPSRAGQSEHYFSTAQAGNTRQISNATAQGRQVTPQGQASMPNSTGGQAPARSSAQASQNSGHGWQKFSGPPRQGSSDRSAPQQSQANRDPGRSQVSSAAPAQRPSSSSQNSGWQHFTPRSDSRPSSGSDRSSGSNRPPVMEREQQRNWHPSQSSGSSSSYGSPRTYAPQRSYAPSGNYASPRSEPRPALSLHRDIVTPRSYSAPRGGTSGGYGGGSRGGSSSGGRSSSSGSSSHGSSSRGSSHPHNR